MLSQEHALLSISSKQRLENLTALTRYFLKPRTLVRRKHCFLGAFMHSFGLDVG